MRGAPSHGAQGSAEGLRSVGFPASLRRALTVVLMPLASFACGPFGETDGTGGQDTGSETTTTSSGGGSGTGGSLDGGGGTGVGGNEVGGGDGTGGTEDPCATLKFEGLGSKTFMPGEEGSFEASNGMRFEIKYGGIVVKPTRVVLQQVLYDNIKLAGFEPVGDHNGVRAVLVDPAQALRYSEEEGDCILTSGEFDKDMMQIPENQPLIYSVYGLHGTGIQRDGDVDSVADSAFENGGTSVRMGSTGSGYIFANSKPKIFATVTRLLDKRLLVDLNGTTDEGQGGEEVLAHLGLSSSNGMAFNAVPGKSGQFISMSPSDLSKKSLEIAVEGLNNAMVEDKATKTVAIVETDMCLDTVTSGHGTCDSETGVVICDTGFTGDADPAADCDSCEEGYTGYPVCEEVPPDLCENVVVIHGTCDSETGVVTCDAGFENDPATPEQCDGCDTQGGYIDDYANNCPPNLCTGVDQANVASCDPYTGDPTCDTGFADDLNKLGEDCQSCDTGYYNYPTCEAIPAPVINNLAIDCNTGGYCISQWPNPYPVTFTAKDALNCTVTPKKLIGNGTPGSVSAVTINGLNASAGYLAGSQGGNVIELKAECNGPGGQALPQTIQISLE